ncbi:MAG: SMC-Scp complex subunit ScpB [Candidatus Bathyarchaeia archaeon]
MEKPKEQPAEPNPDAEQAQDDERRAHCIVLIEAALFVAGRPLDLNELCQVIGSRSKKKAQKYADALMQEYNARSTALEILALKDERYVLQVKAEFTHLIQKLVNRPLLSQGPLKTLSYIALRQPISQKRVIDVRGQHAYGHIKELKESHLIMAEKSGRSMMLRTTADFADYFGLPNDITEMKRNLKKIFGEALKDEQETQKSGANSSG